MAKNKFVDLLGLSKFKEKIINLIPTKVSDLTNDSGFKTTDTTYGVVSKTTNGLAPKLPNETTITKYLRQDGTWATPPDNNTTYSNFVKSGSGAKAGLVPSPGTTAGTTKYLREDGTWQVPPNTQRTIADNLTSTSTTYALSANQGKVLNDLISSLSKTVNAKVDKVSGKGLSTNDYTTIEKDKLSGIASGAEVNVQPDWNVSNSSSDAFIKNKPAALPASDVHEWAKAENKPAYTAEEVGALATTGGTATGPLILEKGSYCHIANAEQGKNGYLKICQIQIKYGYADLTLTFDIYQRHGIFGTLYVQFDSREDADPPLSWFKGTGTCTAYIAKNSTSTWDLYVRKEEAYGCVCVADCNASVDSALAVKWVDEYYENVPDDAVLVTQMENDATTLNNKNGDYYLKYDNINNKPEINGLSLDGSSGLTNYCVCNSTGSVKIVSCPGFTLKKGAEITVNFTNRNNYVNATLNVNNSGDKKILYRGVAAPKEFNHNNKIITLRYDGTNFNIVNALDLNSHFSLNLNGEIDGSGYIDLDPTKGINALSISTSIYNSCTIGSSIDPGWYSFAYCNLQDAVEGNLGLKVDRCGYPFYSGILNCGFYYDTGTIIDSSINWLVADQNLKNSLKFKMTSDGSSIRLWCYIGSGSEYYTFTILSNFGGNSYIKPWTVDWVLGDDPEYDEPQNT